jgi:hypothetical protein
VYVLIVCNVYSTGSFKSKLFRELVVGVLHYSFLPVVWMVASTDASRQYQALVWLVRSQTVIVKRPDKRLVDKCEHATT